MGYPVILNTYGCIFTSDARATLDAYRKAFDGEASARGARQDGPILRPGVGSPDWIKVGHATGIQQRTDPKQSGV